MKKKDLVIGIARENPDDPEIRKYNRVTGKTAKEYQKEINEMFMKIMNNMTKESSKDIPSEDDWELEYDIEKDAEKEFQKFKSEEKEDEELSQEEEGN